MLTLIIRISQLVKFRWTPDIFRTEKTLTILALHTAIYPGLILLVLPSHFLLQEAIPFLRLHESYDFEWTCFSLDIKILKSIKLWISFLFGWTTILLYVYQWNAFCGLNKQWVAFIDKQTNSSEWHDTWNFMPSDNAV